MRPQEERVRKILWQLCHLCNACTSGLSCLLSLEVVLRETGKFDKQFRNQVIVLANVAADIESTRNKLLDDPGYHSFPKDRSTHDLFLAAARIATTLDKIPHQLSLTRSASREEAIFAVMSGHIRLLDWNTEVKALRDFMFEMNELCGGNAQKGIVGWKSLWDSYPF